MGNVIEFKKNDEQLTEVVEVATSQLTEHSKQAEYSPPMSKKKWTEFVANIKDNGIRQPLIVTKGFRVIDGKHRLKAARELGIESVRVIIEDIDENSIPSYITDTKLQRDDLKRGQKAALVIRLFHDKGIEKGKERMSEGGKNKVSPNGETINTHKTLAKMSGVGQGSIGRLLPVYRNRPDLFELVFDGSYSINKAYTQMKADEEPEQEEEITPEESLKRTIEQMIENDSTQPQIDENEHELSPRNRAVRLRKDSLSMSAKILSEAEVINSTDGSVKDSARSQLLSLATSCIITLGQTTENQGERDLLYMALEVIKKIEEDISNG